MERRSFDLIGDVAVIEVDSKKEEKMLVKRIISTYSRVKTILSKESEIKGKYRRAKLRVVWKDPKKVKDSGMGSTETIHKEHGCSFFLDVKKTFFNPRDATIRKRLAGEVKPREKVLVMFSGIAPYPITIAKHVKDCEVTGVELNPDAVKYAEKNLRLNKVQEKVKLFHGDVKDIKGAWNRIIMPLTREGYKYLETAFPLVKNGGTIHFFGLGPKEEPLKQLEKDIQKAGKKTKRKPKVIDFYPIRTYSSGLLQICVNVRV